MFHFSIFRIILHLSNVQLIAEHLVLLTRELRAWYWNEYLIGGNSDDSYDGRVKGNARSSEGMEHTVVGNRFFPHVAPGNIVRFLFY